MIDRTELVVAVGIQGRVARVVVAAHRGSVPRETGVSMLVWRDGAQGTIGGGRLEFEAVARARRMLERGPETGLRRQALGPGLGQCCGGAVSLVTELWDASRLSDVPARGGFARRIEGDAPRPAAPGGALLADGWLIEPVGPLRRPVFIYGAGHVGAALCRVLAPLPEVEVSIADPREALLAALPGNVGCIAGKPQDAMAMAPPQAAHFIMTPSHDEDLELCHHVLQRPFAYAGLIGSATKWARFRRRLSALGHAAAAIDQIECPIGDPSLGKHPQAIAIGVVARLLKAQAASSARGEVA